MEKAKTKTAYRRRAERQCALGFIGGGNMATALIKGLLSSGVYRAEQICASDIDAQRRTALRRRFGVSVTQDNAAVVRAARVIVLAVKPQILAGVLQQVHDAVTPEKLILSIAAGVTTARLQGLLGPGVRILRAMPNTPALLGRAVSVLVRGRYATAADERLGLRLLRAVGQAAAVPDERLLNAVTGLSGSGPAYVYRFAEGMMAGGVAAGLTAQLATQLTLQTISGAAAMLQETGQAPEALRAMVSSPGGTTVAGLSELERRGFKDAVAAAVVTATRRSEELGRG
jgi:pyrroline-5-carboxylate reductase